MRLIATRPNLYNNRADGMSEPIRDPIDSVVQVVTDPEKKFKKGNASIHLL